MRRRGAINGAPELPARCDPAWCDLRVLAQRAGTVRARCEDGGYNRRRCQERTDSANATLTSPRARMTLLMLMTLLTLMAPPRRLRDDPSDAATDGAKRYR